ncbi:MULTISPECIES: menaquinol-cytochrome c reductase cytochrome b/c subunit [unclassified Paenibacillus]|uniref:menaquinol-cytochrome c reductase cytochrome b/c subunit n=1 Tax=unclassified Paenibacillus TaxID=185978 RepID=UPI002788E1CC|nr:MULTISPECIES: menaquinol-cytochrome c reductase cytochrome b/c subunit [unclassified Paenibacillus]MDQ0898351.1 menaquinol-cytochrome c reductase cytochrome b/c subunit [Paenibacillus sp. V4I7]MDQ0915637.1 menaquinol-cytochrome c reductase cytochrome b/c subunit [Paenibacillus sp. V4I5]
MAHGHKSDEKIVYVGDSRVVKKTQEQRLIPKDYSAYPGKSEAFVPNFLLKEWMVGVVVLVGMLVLVMTEPAPLGYPADPKNTAFIPMPDWYFLFMYQLLKYPYTSGDYVVLGAVVVPGLLFGGLLLAPFLDTGKERRFYRRPIASSLMILSLIACTYLTYTSWSHYQVELKEKNIIPEHIKREEEMHANKGAAAGGGGAKETKKSAAIVAADDPGAELYKKATCLSCHGAGLKGMPASGVPALLGIGDKMSQDEILGVIKNGKGNMGKQYQGNIDKGLSDADINKLAEWLSKQKAQ